MKRLLLIPVLMLLFAAPAKASILYDQFGQGPFSHWTSQSFDAPNDGFNTEIAVDFDVPSIEKWQLSKITTLGNNTGEASPPPSFASATIYKDAGGKPGAQVANQAVPASPLNYVLTLNSPISLDPGSYWISIRSIGGDLDSQWYWNFHSEQSGEPAMFRNPGNDSGFDCIEFKPLSDCIPGSPEIADAFLRMEGTASFVPGAGPSVGKAKLNARKGTAKLPVSVPAAGDLEMVGKDVAPKSVGIAAAGTTQLPIKPTGSLKKKLKKKGKATAKLTIAFTTENDATTSQKVNVKLKKKIKKKKGKKGKGGKRALVRSTGGFTAGG